LRYLLLEIGHYAVGCLRLTESYIADEDDDDESSDEDEESDVDDEPETAADGADNVEQLTSKLDQLTTS